MITIRRLACVASLSLGLLSAHAVSAAFPDKPIRIVVPYSAGGSSDLLARAIAEPMSTDLGQPVIVENRAGAGSMVGTAFVAGQPADGHTLLLADVPYTIVAALYAGRLKYDPRKDLAPVALLGESPMYLFVTAGSKATSLADVLKMARERPGQMTIGSGGNGSLTHLMAELLMLNTGIRLAHVPYKGAAAAMNDLAGGQVELSFSSMASATAVLGAGKVRPIAVSAPAREAAHNQTPTFRESGFERMTVQNWWGVMLPSGTPADRVQVLERAVLKVVTSPAFAQRLAALGVSLPQAAQREHFARMLAEDFARWEDLVTRADIKVSP
jgi:tripartite-type tricarboxylate transporter receptor subunit TctC